MREKSKTMRSNWILEAIGVILLVASVAQVTWKMHIQILLHFMKAILPYTVTM